MGRQIHTAMSIWIKAIWKPRSFKDSQLIVVQAY